MSKQTQKSQFTAAQVSPVVKAITGTLSRQAALSKAIKAAKAKYGLKDEGKRRQFNKVVLAQFPAAKRRSVSVTLSRGWAEAMGRVAASTTRKPTLRTKLGRLVEAYGYAKVSSTLKALNA